MACTTSKGTLKCNSNVFQPVLWTIRDMTAKINRKVNEEERLASPIPVASSSPEASPSTVCTRCPVLEQKIIFYQKKISSLRRTKSKLQDMSRRVKQL